MEARSATTPPSNSLPLGYQGETVSVLDVGFLIAVSVLIFSAIVTSIYARIPKTMQHSFSPRWRDKAPCRHCQYLNHNPYIKCALHPKAVLTDKAVDCQDYCPNSVAKRGEE